MRLLIVVFLATAAAGQSTTEYPNAPSEQSTYLRPGQDIVVHEGESVTVSEHPATPVPDKRRHRKRLLLLAGAVLFDEAAGQYDIRETEIGLRHGVAFEGNTWLVGSRPSYSALMKRDQVEVGAFVVLPILGWVKRWPVLFFGTLDAPVALGIAHIKGGDAWRKLMGE